MIYVRVYDGVMMVVGGDVDSFCRVFLVLVYQTKRERGAIGWMVVWGDNPM
jgi:hypothetical protein